MVPSPPFRRRRRAGAALAVTVLALCLASHALAQSVVKCVDTAGNVTYQNSPCERGQAGRPIEPPKAETREDNSAWEAAARDGRVLKGMPKRWVLRARGNPAEIRPGGAREEASEVWRYAARDGGAMLVGFTGGDVAWVREDTRSGAAPTWPAGAPTGPGAGGTAASSPSGAGGASGATAAAPPAAQASAAPSGSLASTGASTAGARTNAAIRGPQNRRFVIAGRYCEHVFAEIGPADREEALPGGADPGTGRRYVFEPAPGDASMRTVFSCIDGRVADVERTLVR